MNVIKIVSIAGVDFILKGKIEDHDGLDNIEVVKIYSRKRSTDLKPFLSDNALFLIEKELRGE